jgi:ComEC/Rec2-related protein
MIRRIPPLFFPLVGLLAGILSASMWGEEMSANLIIFPLVLSVCFGFLTRWRTLALSLLFVGVGWGTWALHCPAQLPAECYQCKMAYSGIVREVHELRGGRVAIVELILPEGRRTKAQLSLISLEPEVDVGTEVKFQSHLHPLQSDAEVPDEVDYSAELRRRGVTAAGYVAPGELIVIGTLKPNAVRDRLLRADGLSSGTIDILCAVLLGDTSLLNPDLRAEYSAAGLAHVLALSGTHVAVITALISVLLLPLYVSRYNRTRRFITIAALWAFAAFTGFSPSVTRAVIMASVYLLGANLERNHSALNSLCLAAILILSFMPRELFGVGFQLTFAAVLGIIVFYPILNCVDRRGHPWVYRAVGAVAVSVSAVSLSGFIAAYWFHSFPLLFVLTNLLIAPLVPLLVGGGALYLVMALAGLPCQWLVPLLNAVTVALNSVAHWAAEVPGGVVDNIYFSAWWLIPLFAAMTLFAVAGMRRRLVPVAFGLMLMGWTVTMMRLTEPTWPRSEIFVATNSRCTDVVMRTDTVCYLFTTMQTATDRADELSACSARYRHYLARRRCGTLHLLPAATSPCFIAGTDTVQLLTATEPLPPARHVGRLVITAGYRGDLPAVMTRFTPDTVILSRDINSRRRARLAGAGGNCLV